MKYVLTILLLASTVFGTVNITTVKTGPTVGDDSTVAFVFPFSFTATSEIVVTSRVVATGAATVQTETTDYSVSSPTVGGTVTFVTAPASTATITISRTTPKTQDNDIDAGSSISLTALEASHDKAMRLIQELQEENDRTSKYPITDATATIGNWPNSVDRASKFPFFGNDGVPTVAAGVTADDVVVSVYAETYLDDTDSDKTMATLQGVTVFNVKNSAYGATGDGVTDDTAAIVLAEAAAVAAGGGIVFFPEGTYLISGTDAGNFRRGIQITGDNVIFMGVGENSIIKQFATEAMHCFSSTSNTVPAKNLRFTRLRFEGNGLCDASSATSAAFQFALFEGIEVDHCSFDGFRAIFNGGTGTTTVSQRLWFHYNNVFGGSSSVTAVGIKCQFAKEIWITDNEFRKVARPLSIEINSSPIYTVTSVWFCRNVVTEGTKTTFSCVSDSYQGCQISGTDASNVINDIHITDNTFKDNDLGTGTVAYDVFINGADGAETTEGVIVRGNTFSGLNGDGNSSSVYILNAHRNIVTDNLFLNPDVVVGPAIRVRGLGGSVGSTENIIANNIISGANWANALQEGTNIATEQGNVFLNNHDTTLGVSFTDIATTKSFVFGRGSSESWRFMVGSQNNSAFMNGSGMQLGANSSTQGILTLWDGSGGNKPAAVFMHTPDGTGYYSFIDDLGTPRVHTSTPTQNSDGVSVGTLTAKVELTSTNIKALVGTPITLVAAQGADTVIEFVSAVMIHDAGTAYVEPSAPDDMVIEYDTGTDVSGSIDATGFLTVTSDEIRSVPTTLALTVDLVPEKNAALRLLNTGGDYTTGTGTMTLQITYRVHTLGL